MPEARRVRKVAIARRMQDGQWSQGQKIKITIGNSKKYDPTEPECLPEIADLTRTKGLQDYVCTNQVSGKYVKISRPGVMVLCEVKVYTTKNGGLPSGNLPGKFLN